MRTRKEILLQHLETQTRNWSHWVSAGLALGRVATLPPVLGSIGLAQTGTVASWCLPAILGLGAHQALSAATTVTYAPSLSAGTVHVNQGEPFNLAVVVNSTKHGSPRSYKVSGSVPAGISPGSSQVTNGRTLIFSGTPTQTGSFSVSFKAYANANARGDSSPTYKFTLVVDATVAKPVFASQPAQAFANWGGSAQFTASVTNATNLQWRRNGVGLTDGAGVAGSHTQTLTLTGLTSADQGMTFDLVATGSDGSTVTSSSAQLDVTTSHFDLWREQMFAGNDLFNNAVSGPTANPDGDARDNALEFALNSNPEVVDPLNPFTRTIKNVSGNYVLELSFTVNPIATESDLSVEQALAANLGTWEPLPTTTIDRTQPGHWVVDVPLIDSAAFIRLRATP